MKKKFGLLSTIIPALTVAVVLFTGCPDPTTPETNNQGTETTWVYDFMTAGNGEAVFADAGGWFVKGSYGEMGRYSEESAYGLYLNRYTIAPPVLFTGDFTVSFEFYLKLTDPEDYIYTYVLSLVGPPWPVADMSAQYYFDFYVNYIDYPAHEWAVYALLQGQENDRRTDHDGNVPGSQPQINTCVMEKEGNTITVTMNGTRVGMATIDPANYPADGYAPAVYGHNSIYENDNNFYIRKITVTCNSNEVQAYNWP